MSTSTNIIGYATFVATTPIFANRAHSHTGWKKQRMRTLVRDNFICQVEGCHETQLGNLGAHHKLPKSQGGLDNLDNLVTICNHHHAEIHNGGILYLKDGAVCCCDDRVKIDMNQVAELQQWSAELQAMFA
jgi:hypothetical protein